jgi:hypothetical protein
VRRQATDFTHPATVLPPPTFETAIDTIEEQSPTVELIQINTQLGEARPADQSEMSPLSPLSPGSPGSPRGRPRTRREARDQMLFGSQTRFASPEARFVCDGWCKYSDEPHPNVVSIEHLLFGDSRFHVCRQLSLSACSDLQRAWEGPKGSLTTVLCNYLSKRISYNIPISRSDRSHQRITVAHHTVP